MLIDNIRAQNQKNSSLLNREKTCILTFTTIKNDIQAITELNRDDWNGTKSVC